MSYIDFEELATRAINREVREAEVEYNGQTFTIQFLPVSNDDALRAADLDNTSYVRRILGTYLINHKTGQAIGDKGADLLFKTKSSLWLNTVAGKILIETRAYLDSFDKGVENAVKNSENAQ
jgi:hypothetical protein